MKRPPRLVWCLVNARGVVVGVYMTRKTAAQGLQVAFDRTLRIAGPYMLAERVRQE